MPASPSISGCASESSAEADRLPRQSWRLHAAFSGRENPNAMVDHDFPVRGPPSRKRSVDGLCRGFLVLNQGVGRLWRRRRTHLGCIGCGETHDPALRITALRDEAPSNQQRAAILFRVWPGLHLPSRPYGVRQHGAQGRGKAGRCAALNTSCAVSRPRLARPSTVPPLREAVPILDMVMCESPFLAAAGDTRMGGNHASGFRRAAVFRRADSTRPEPAGRGGRPREGPKSDSDGGPDPEKGLTDNELRAIEPPSLPLPRD